MNESQLQSFVTTTKQNNLHTIQFGLLTIVNWGFVLFMAMRADTGNGKMSRANRLEHIRHIHSDQGEHWRSTAMLAERIRSHDVWPARSAFDNRVSCHALDYVIGCCGRLDRHLS